MVGTHAKPTFSCARMMTEYQSLFSHVARLQVHIIYIYTSILALDDIDVAESEHLTSAARHRGTSTAPAPTTTKMYCIYKARKNERRHYRNKRAVICSWCDFIYITQGQMFLPHFLGKLVWLCTYQFYIESSTTLMAKQCVVKRKCNQTQTQPPHNCDYPTQIRAYSLPFVGVYIYI